MTVSYRDFDLRYSCELSALDDKLAARFVELEFDEATREFMDGASSARHSTWQGILHATLTNFMSDYDVNGVLNMYPMFLIAEAQWRRLLGNQLAAPPGRLFDIGAGSGDVTRELAPIFASVHTAELSRPMARRLRRQGFECHGFDVSGQAVPGAPYQVVSCLNILDRCARPLALLEHASEALAPDGLLVLATPLPFEPFVYRGAITAAPQQQLQLSKQSWERAASELVQLVQMRFPLSARSLSRCPYLSWGDSARPLYMLDDAVIVFEKTTSTAGTA